MREQLATETHFERIEGVDVSESLFYDRAAFIEVARTGVPGDVVKQAVRVLGYRELFVRLLDTTTGNLNRFYQRKALSQAQSEGLLDTLRVFSKAIAVFGDLARARDWMSAVIPALGAQSPIDLCDTFEGRDLVQEALRKIEYGEFA